jgi:uncharacterized membrane protein
MGHDRKRSSVGDAEFAVDPVELNLHGTFRQPKPAADFRVCNSFGELAHNLVAGARSICLPERWLRTGSAQCIVSAGTRRMFK